MNIMEVEVGRDEDIKSKIDSPRSRAVRPFIQNIYGDNQEQNRILNILHSLIDGNKGKYVAMVIYASYTANLIRKPTFAEVRKEFGDIGNQSGYNKYIREAYVFTESELNAIRSRF